jgi:hypothetical protein
MGNEVTKDKEQLKKELTPDQYEICINHCT